MLIKIVLPYLILTLHQKNGKNHKLKKINKFMVLNCLENSLAMDYMLENCNYFMNRCDSH